MAGSRLVVVGNSGKNSTSVPERGILGEADIEGKTIWTDSVANRDEFQTFRSASGSALVSARASATVALRGIGPTGAMFRPSGFADR